jgi:hypothetical protein
MEGFFPARALDSIPVHAITQGFAGESQQAGGPHDISLGLVEDLADPGGFILAFAGVRGRLSLYCRGWLHVWQAPALQALMVKHDIRV